ncbi:hypothetical protein [Spirosoma fluviale]|uniref:Redox-active disulfide protein 2 n=1 Tax=Spirosoma fluviale TaxID=1597977 RepID=A0A286G5W1_9BACT|nr:hypothetical protein [Spirosoma fluviale]SOD90519.1 hypothetical protein SAMN06269250_3448 [Spirosoma fluviale]
MKQLSELSVDELHQQQKSTRRVAGAMIGLLVSMAAVSLFLTFQKGFSVLTMLPVFFLPLALTSFDKLKKIKAELRLRG